MTKRASEPGSWLPTPSRIDAEIDAADHTLTSLEATPRVLPFTECKWAAPSSSQLIGLPVTRFRTLVQQTLTELQTCTHLNDMLRCFAELPTLAEPLRRR